MNNIERQIQELKDQLRDLEVELKISSFTANDLIEFLKETKYSSFISGETNWKCISQFIDQNTIEKIGPLALVFTKSDYDEGCNPISNVYFFEKLNCFVQFKGYYASYDGYHFEDCFLVEPEEYTAIRYNKI